MAVQPQGQRLHSLKKQEGVEGGDGRAGIPKQNGPDAGDKGGGAGGVHKGHPVIAGVGLGNGSIPAAGLPVKFAAVYNDSPQSGAVAANKLGGGVDDDIGAVFNGPDEVGRAEGIVNYQGQAVPVGDGCNGVNVGDVAVGVARASP